ncbi:MAG: hypothetical protein GDA51_06390 [Ekhidna sp.]|nr:hypothetical protein [Ekhidna sp.]
MRLATESAFNELKGDLSSHKTQLNWTFGFVIAVMIACFLTFVALSIDAFKFHNSTEGELNKTINKLMNENYQLKINSLKENIEALHSEVRELKKEYYENKE